MTFAQLKSRLAKRLDEDPAAPVFYTSAQMGSAINAALRVFVLLTLCVEGEYTLTLDPNVSFYSLLSKLSVGWVLPLRVLWQSTRLYPATVRQWHATDPQWMLQRNNPREYVFQGWDCFGVYPCTFGPGYVLTITAARQAADLTADGDVPEIPNEDHDSLVDFAGWWLRVAEGGQEFVAGSEYLNRFIDACKSRAEMVRKRAKNASYDREPIELTRVDLTRLLEAASEPKHRRRG